MKLVTRSFHSFSKIGFIGLGNMGFPMAINLAKKGHQVYAFDIDHSKEAEAKKHNIVFRKDTKQVTKDANIFVTMLPTSAHTRILFQSDVGIFKNANPGSWIIDSSTIAPSAAVAFHEDAKKHQLNYIDAPVTGAVPGATAGTLNFLVGAENNTVFEIVKPTLQGMGKNIFNCGRIGAGQIVKICNNMALAVQMIAVAQALALGKTLGMDEKILTNIMKVSSSRCWSVDTYNPVPGVLENVPASRDYEGGFASDLMLKDLKLAVEMAKGHSKVELGQHTKQIYERLSALGYGSKDFGVIYDLLLNKKT